MSSKETAPEKAAGKANGKDGKDGSILVRYFFILVLLSMVAVAILISAFRIGLVEKKEWLKVAEGMKKPDLLVSPVRGNIYSDDDRLMATSAPQYYMYMDFGAEGFALDSFQHSKHNNVDSLAHYLSRKLRNRTPAGYKAHLLKGLKSKKRQYPVYEGRVSYADLKEIKTYPFLRFHRNRSGFYTRELMMRQKPFDMLASRTIGDIYNEVDLPGITKGKNGLELQYDSLLCGVAGLNSVQRVGGRWTNITEVEPVNGMDIRSTIDINIQDLVEKALTDKLRELDADAGTAVVMEVRTGEIKAITNMGRLGPGRFAETMNHAVADEIEPGSTFKVASMMVAIDDGLVEPGTPVDVGEGVYHHVNSKITDHNANHGGYGMITAEKAIWYSSNIGVAKLILKGYGTNPEKFVDGLHRIGMDANLRIEIPGAGKAKLRRPGDRYWSHTSLPWMSFGYEVQIPPIQTLTFFNAIANNGKMVRPMFVRDIMKNGKVVKHFEPEVIIPAICSERTLEIVRDMLYNVVNYRDPTPARRHGTGSVARSDVITIAGKTGTAQIASGGVYKTAGHHVSFCGYFPSEAPLYSCIVVISRPRVGFPSGGSMCGPVVREIAEKVYANCMVFDMKKAPEDSLKIAFPSVKNGRYDALKNVADEFRIKINAKGSKGDDTYVAAKGNGEGLAIRELPLVENLVPDVTGMGAKDAVYALESCGLRVSLSGKGHVTSQSVAKGSRATPGQTVVLKLSD
ncbi:MAG: transpeptidase family protein [Tannerella sp.]|jgi:cell division protein FtsI (penicillin-binding protein 3)|nr:transpeptidase family protein [Tannerella sp.]